MDRWLSMTKPRTLDDVITPFRGPGFSVWYVSHPGGGTTGHFGTREAAEEVARELWPELKE
jgi:hypothetical protein